MIFSDLYKSPRSPLSKLRHLQTHPGLSHQADVDPDLLSRDKAKQKEAVKKFLAAKVRNDWEFKWPPAQAPPTPLSPSTSPSNQTASGDLASHELEGYLELAIEDVDGSESRPESAPDAIADSGDEADSETGSIYSSMSEDPAHFRPRAEWSSDISDDEVPPSATTAEQHGSFRFDTPDSVGAVVKASVEAYKTKRRRALRKEMSWNPGVACFEHRRNAWTGARTVCLRPKSNSPSSPSPSRRVLFWRTLSHGGNSTPTSLSPSSTNPTGPSPLSPVSSNSPQNSHLHDSTTTSATVTAAFNSPTPTAVPEIPGRDGPLLHHTHSHAHSNTSDGSDAAGRPPVETVLPLAPPLLPPGNPMRASITPALYLSIYDKVVLSSLSPSCPINLSDMVRACVAGWKRDGEWPPKVSEPVAVAAASTTTQSQHQHLRRISSAANGSSAADSGVLSTRRRKKKEQQQPQSQEEKKKRDSFSANGITARRMSFPFLGSIRSDNSKERDGDGDAKEKDKGADGSAVLARRESVEDGGAGKAIRRSLQKVLSLTHSHAHDASAAPSDAHVKEAQHAQLA